MSTSFQPLLKYADSVADLAKEFVAIQSKSLSKINALNKDVVTSWYDTSTAQLRSASVPSGYQEWLDSQTKFFGEQGSKAQKYGTDYLKLLEEAQAEFTAWVQRGTETVTKSANEILKTKAA